MEESGNLKLIMTLTETTLLVLFFIHFIRWQFLNMKLWCNYVLYIFLRKKKTNEANRIVYYDPSYLKQGYKSIRFYPIIRAFLMKYYYIYQINWQMKRVILCDYFPAAIINNTCKQTTSFNTFHTIWIFIVDKIDRIRKENHVIISILSLIYISKSIYLSWNVCIDLIYFIN